METTTESYARTERLRNTKKRAQAFEAFASATERDTERAREHRQKAAKNAGKLRSAVAIVVRNS